jgi:hypothetical protein
MSVQTTVTGARPGRRWRSVIAAAVLAGSIAVAVLLFAISSGTGESRSGIQKSRSAVASSAPLPVRGSDAIMSLTPARLAAGALGTGYALPSAPSGPTLASVLASMSPQTRRYTQAIMSLTFAQLAAGAAGSP